MKKKRVAECAALLNVVMVGRPNEVHLDIGGLRFPEIRKYVEALEGLSSGFSWLAEQYMICPRNEKPFHSWIKSHQQCCACTPSCKKVVAMDVVI